MDLTEGSALGVFSCQLCEVSSPYSFYGQKPPNTRAIVNQVLWLLLLTKHLTLLHPRGPSGKAEYESGKYTLFIRLLEECFGIKDPFSPEREKFLILGSKCSLCSKTVCVGTVRRSCDSQSEAKL